MSSVCYIRTKCLGRMLSQHLLRCMGHGMNHQFISFGRPPRVGVLPSTYASVLKAYHYVQVLVWAQFRIAWSCASDLLLQAMHVIHLRGLIAATCTVIAFLMSLSYCDTLKSRSGTGRKTTCTK